MSCPQKILIVDDDADVLLTLEELVSCTCGAASVITARDGVEALELLRAGLRPCRILTDLRMPGMSGEELTEAVRIGDFGAIPVITMTACLGAVTAPPGAAMQLGKPFTIGQLERAFIATAGAACRFARDAER